MGSISTSRERGVMPRNVTLGKSSTLICISAYLYVAEVMDVEESSGRMSMSKLTGSSSTTPTVLGVNHHQGCS
jgi:hypothetical protein